MICGLIGHKKYSCPAPPQPLPQEKYAISLKAITVSRPRLLLSPSASESTSVLSSDSPASSHSTAPLEIFHGAESHKLQFVPCRIPLHLSSHVPMDNSSNSEVPDPSHISKYPYLFLSPLSYPNSYHQCLCLFQLVLLDHPQQLM
jgi:hypothetical protein